MSREYSLKKGNSSRGKDIPDRCQGDAEVHAFSTKMHVRKWPEFLRKYAILKKR